MSDQTKHNRQVANMAARNVRFYSAQLGSDAARAHMAAGLCELDARLIAEAAATDHWHCSQDEMLTLLRAEYAKVDGQSLGGHVTAVNRRHVAKRAPSAT